MARTKQAGSRKSNGPQKETPGGKAGTIAPTPAGLIGMFSLTHESPSTGAWLISVDKAHTLLAQSNFELAAQFLDRALELEPTNLEARELLGVAHLEAGDPEVGRNVRPTLPQLSLSMY